MEYIDAHVHVWTDDFDRYPIAEPHQQSDMKPATFRPEELFVHTESSGVNRVVLIQMSFYGFDNSYMLDVMNQYAGVFSGLAVIDWNGERPEAEMRRLAQRGVRGFRIYPKDAPIESWLDGRGFERMFAAGAEHNLAICPLIDPDALPALDKRCEQFPETPVIIDHLCCIGANPPIRDAHIDQLCAMARHPKVMVKVSAFYALGRKTPPYDDLASLIQRVYEAFGSERLMWGSDCPYQVVDQTYADGIGLVRDRLDFLSESDKNQILRKTAEDFFF
ncbi:MAG: amidohydrolase family protein [Candidatus Poribacteria bacterium]|nr:amidohydrolase family protein [Candidatus Poribacteria bacterium]